MDEYPKLVYVQKILHYLSTDKSNHNTPLEGGSIKYGDCNSILTYLQDKCKNIKDVTKNKYVVILYGPPGSGKSLARKIACNIIKTHYHEKVSEKEIESDFIDSGIDEITYEILEPKSNKEVRTLLMDNLRQKLGIDTNTPINKDPYFEQIKNDSGGLLKELATSSFQIYRNNRKDSLSELLFFLQSPSIKICSWKWHLHRWTIWTEFYH